MSTCLPPPTLCRHSTHPSLALPNCRPDGSYWSCGLACGMDNQPRVEEGCSAWCDHSHTAWIDATAQALLSARLLVRMATEVGRADLPAVAACIAEVVHLRAYLHDHMWDDGASTFADRLLKARVAAPATGGAGAAGGAGSSSSSAAAFDLSLTRTVGAYWTLLADAVSDDRLWPFLHALDDPSCFNRPVRVPSLSFLDGSYTPTGGYWLGGVSAPVCGVVRACWSSILAPTATGVGSHHMDGAEGADARGCARRRR